MPDITIPMPSIGMEAFFTFKDPISYYFRNKFNISTSASKLKVVSVISMRDIIRSDLRDPYSDLYVPAGIDETEYKKDLNDNIPIITFYYTDRNDIERYMRCPLNYVDSVSGVGDNEYINKLIVIDMKYQPTSLDSRPHFNDLLDFIKTRTGIEAEVREVSIGDVLLLDNDEHELRESIRANNTSVYKTKSIQLEEMTLKYNELLKRLDELNISLE